MYSVQSKLVYPLAVLLLCVQHHCHGSDSSIEKGSAVLTAANNHATDSSDSESGKTEIDAKMVQYRSN